ncbi:hypothetical protein HUJ04_005022 [Dendroctonus ponderosae]|nr:hypothetical protein HUJ04_005022 [Dendroctonus ponderosae]
MRQNLKDYFTYYLISSHAVLKEKLEEKEGIPPQQQRLVFQGKQLKDDKTVNSYKLKAGTVLHLVVALRGGEDNNIIFFETP